MRETACSDVRHAGAPIRPPSRPASVLLLVSLSTTMALAGTGCIVRDSKLRRGAQLGVTEVGRKVEDRPVLDVDASGPNARLGLIRKTCRQIAREYAQVEVQEIENMSGLIAPLVMAAIGSIVFLVGASDTSDDDENGEIMMGIGAAIAIGGALPGCGLLVDGKATRTTYREVPARTTEKGLDTQCSEDRLRVSGEIPWRVTLGSSVRSGRMDAANRLELLPVLVDLFREVSQNERALRRVVSGRNVAYSVELGETRASAQLDSRRLPDEIFASLAERYGRTLSGAELVRWENCRLIANTAREAFECIWAQD